MVLLFFFHPLCLIDEMVCDGCWCSIESIIFSTGCLSMTKGTLLCKHRVSQYLKYNECIVHCQLVLWWSFCLEIQSIWSSIFDVWWFNPEELHKMDRAWNSQTEAFIDYLQENGAWLAKTKKIRNFWLFKNNLRIIPSTYLKRTEWSFHIQVGRTKWYIQAQS